MKQDCKFDHLESAVTRHWHIHGGVSYKHPDITVSTANFPAQTLHVIRRFFNPALITLSLKAPQHFSIYPKRILHTLPRTKGLDERSGGLAVKEQRRVKGESGKVCEIPEFGSAFNYLWPDLRGDVDQDGPLSLCDLLVCKEWCRP